MQPPWWILTNYAERNDQMSLLDGAVLILYIAATAGVIGGFVSLCLAAATLCLGRWSWARFHHLAQSLVPIAGCGVFLGLSALTVTMLRVDWARLADRGPRNPRGFAPGGLGHARLRRRFHRRRKFGLVVLHLVKSRRVRTRASVYSEDCDGPPVTR
jgi:hypothetical protein